VTKNVRKIATSVAACCLALVPGAVAAPEKERRDPAAKRLVAHTALDKHWKHTKRELKQAKREMKQERRERKATGGAPAVSVPPQLESIAQCESGGNPRAIGGGGMYRGKYQFSTATWAAVGGQGDPAAAPEEEQDRRAAMLYARSGAGQWPVCGA
jgi:Transglycosylase-like domain